MPSFRKAVSLVFLAAIFAVAALAQQHKSLTNKDVSDMAKQGLADDVIIKVIQASDTNFDVSPDALAQLQSGGVSQAVVEAMTKAQAAKSAAPNLPAAPSNASALMDGAAATPPPASAAAPVAQPADASAGKFLLHESTEVELKFANDLSSKTASDGDKVELVLDSDLKIGEVVVARKGAHAVATVVNAKKAGMMGKPGELNIQLEHMVAGDNRVRLRGTKGREGDSKTGTAVALTVLFGPIGLIKHGKNVEIKAGTPLTAFVDQDIWLPPAS